MNRQEEGEKLAGKFDQIKYNNDYNRQNYDRIGLMAPKGRKDEIKKAARAAGMSLNEYILTAVAEKMGKFENNPVCGGTWAEHRKRLFTPEEIAESDLRVTSHVK